MRENDSPNGIDPESILFNWVTAGDVARDTLVEAVFPKDAKCCSETVLQVLSFFVLVFECRCMHKLLLCRRLFLRGELTLGRERSMTRLRTSSC